MESSSDSMRNTVMFGFRADTKQEVTEWILTTTCDGGISGSLLGDEYAWDILTGLHESLWLASQAVRNTQKPCGRGGPVEATSQACGEGDEGDMSKGRMADFTSGMAQQLIESILAGYGIKATEMSEARRDKELDDISVPRGKIQMDFSGSEDGGRKVIIDGDPKTPLALYDPSLARTMLEYVEGAMGTSSTSSFELKPVSLLTPMRQSIGWQVGRMLADSGGHADRGASSLSGLPP